ncbi:MAG: IPT/TIG domain-containing protein, partial [Methanomicrobiales archaeon]|nr:IPT/TIG domain-containing protein [Methanomicrobiales archaeon]
MNRTLILRAFAVLFTMACAVTIVAATTVTTFTATADNLVTGEQGAWTLTIRPATALVATNEVIITTTDTEFSLDGLNNADFTARVHGANVKASATVINNFDGTHRVTIVLDNGVETNQDLIIGIADGQITNPAAGTYPTAFRVTTTADVDSKSAQVIIYLGPAPTVTSITPASGPTAGGTDVTIGGADFLDGGSFGVTIGGNPATNVVRVDATHITATTPAHAAGAVDVVVTNSDGQTGTLADGYTYVAPPTVTGITPASGPTAGGTAVTIGGSNFVAGGSFGVTIGGADASGVWVDATHITATTLAHAAGAVDVVVTNSDGQTGTLTNGYTYVAPPTVVTAATNTAGTIITITFSKAMANPAGKQGEFAYQVGGGADQPFSAAALNADTARIDLTTSGTTIGYGNTVTVSYTAGTIVAADGGVLATFSGQGVTNNVPPPPVGDFWDGIWDSGTNT